MHELFADTSYWIALLNPRDELHEKATTVSRKSSSARIVTTEMVLVELLNSFSESGPRVRTAAAATVGSLRADPMVTIRAQTTEQFAGALELYRQARDKGWSLTDCASFEVMRMRGIQAALTFDYHFVQAGYEALLR